MSHSLHFSGLLPPENAKFGQQIEITTKNHMFSYKFYPNHGNFTPPWMVWMVTFSKSGYMYDRLFKPNKY